MSPMAGSLGSMRRSQTSTCWVSCGLYIIFTLSHYPPPSLSSHYLPPSLSSHYHTISIPHCRHTITLSPSLTVITLSHYPPPSLSSHYHTISLPHCRHTITLSPPSLSSHYHTISLRYCHHTITLSPSLTVVTLSHYLPPSLQRVFRIVWRPSSLAVNQVPFQSSLLVISPPKWL